MLLPPSPLTLGAALGSMPEVHRRGRRPSALVGWPPDAATSRPRCAQLLFEQRLSFCAGGTMKKRAVIAAAIVVTTALVSIGTRPPPVAAATTTQGVTASTIRVGIPYVDFAAVRAIGVNLNVGNYSDAYQALIANMNAHGGILGRRIVPYLDAVSPLSAAPAATSCTQRTEDDHVFVALAPLMPDCYLADNVPTINGSGLEQKGVVPGGAPNFTLTPPSSAYDPLALSVFSKLGEFKGKKVGIFGGDTTDKAEMGVVEAALKKLHVDVTETAIDAA